MAKTLNIKGVADFSSISKEVKDLNNVIEGTFGKKGLKIIDESSLTFLRKQANSTLSQMQSQLRKLKDEAKSFDTAMKGIGVNDTKAAELSRKRLDNLKKIQQAEKDISSMQRGTNVIKFGGKTPEDQRASFGKLAGGQASRGISGVASQLPGGHEAGMVTGAASGAIQAGLGAGLGAGAIAGLTLLGVAAAGAAVAVARAAAGFDVFKEAIPDLLGLAGRGQAPIEDQGTFSKAAQFGYSPLDVFKTQKSLGGAFGQAGATGPAVLSNMVATRGLGLDQGQIAGAGERLRQVGGTEQASKQTAMLIEKAFTSGMDKTQASHYLDSAVGLLTDLNQTGQMDSDRLIATFTSLSKNNMSPEQAAKSLKGINSAISGSSGEANAFFQSAYARAGLGGGTIQGTQFAVAQGLQGANMGSLQKELGGTDEGRKALEAIQGMGLGDKDYSQKAAGGILRQANRFATGPGGEAAKLGFVNQQFGGKTAEDAARVLNILEKIEKEGASKKNMKLLDEATKGPTEKWQSEVLAQLKVNDTAAKALNTTMADAVSKGALFELGKASSEMFNKLTTSMSSLDGSVKDLAEILGGTKDKQSLPEAIKGGFSDLVSNPSDVLKGALMPEKQINSFKDMMGGGYNIRDKSPETGTPHDKLVEAIQENTKVHKENAKRIGTVPAPRTNRESLKSR